jgi:predicted AlkP superfamily pyrophosphatase or phosphodiesterase
VDNSLGIEPCDRAVVILIDGLGAELLAGAAEIAPTLVSLQSRRLSTVFPSTTPAGLGSLGTGSTPGTHGLVGASFLLPETGKILHPLSWVDDPNPIAVQPERTVFESVSAHGLAVRAVSPSAYSNSGLTRAVLRGAQYRGADTVDARVNETALAVADRRSLAYVYWGELDKCGHVYGVASEHWREELAQVDAFVERVLARLPLDCRVVLTADHGMIDVPVGSRIDLDVLPVLWDSVTHLAGEPRARHVYARAGAGAEVLAAWQETLGDHAWVMSRNEAERLFGEMDDMLVERVGDVVAVARDGWSLVSDRTDSFVSGLIGQHGGLSLQELAIPLLTR